MNSTWYPLELGTTAACTNRLMEETKGLRHRFLERSKGDCFLFDSWFLLKKAAEVAASIGVDLIGMVKTNTKRFSRLIYRG